MLTWILAQSIDTMTFTAIVPMHSSFVLPEVVQSLQQHPKLSVVSTATCTPSSQMSNEPRLQKLELYKLDFHIWILCLKGSENFKLYTTFQRIREVT
jgi:hypothetical protein